VTAACRRRSEAADGEWFRPSPQRGTCVSILELYAMREGNLEAPTRHPLDWREPDFYNAELLDKELERVFDICHGCRRCVSLCNAFPTLFDLIDEGKTGELDGVAKADFQKVVDQCYLCDVCYMTKCPYVPPHPWNVDFPHLMLRAKATNFKAGKVRRADRILSSTDALGKLAGIPVVVQLANATARNKAARSAMQSMLHVHPEARLPEYHSDKFRSTAKPNGAHPVKDGNTSPGKVAIFATCYVNYNDPGIGRDLLAVLDHNTIPYVFAEKEACCGMPKFEVGDLESVAKLKDVNVPRLARLAREGYAILTPIPSCTLMFKQELPLMFPDDPDVKAVQAAMFDPFEYLIARNKDGLLRTDFKQSLGRVSYHIPCHLRVQNVGQKTRETLQLIPGIELTTVERCSGHAGTWGVKEAFFETAMKIGRPVFRQMSANAPDYISSDCALAGMHIEQGIERSTAPAAAAAPKSAASSGTPAAPVGAAASDHPAKIARKAHPITLLRLAYGI
jgi:Fe-S oxidoreductase